MSAASCRLGMRCGEDWAEESPFRSIVISFAVSCPTACGSARGRPAERRECSDL
jgi:hypothetical protein